MTEATPRPWKIEDTERDLHNQDEFLFHVVGPDYKTNYDHLVLDNENYYPHDVSRTNAELIVTAVNAHANLVATLEAVIEHHIWRTRIEGGGSTWEKKVIPQVAAALAKGRAE